MPDDEVAEPTPARPPTVGAAYYFGAILTALFLVRLLGASWTSHFPAVWPDATYPKEGYLAVAAKGPFRPSFYNAFRPVGYPFLLWMFGRNTQLVVLAQSALYCAAVAALVTSARRIFRSQVVAAITALFVTGIAVQAKFALWNTQILSESLAISLGLVALAAWWRFAAAPTRSRGVWAFGFTVAWLVTRDAHVLPATVVIVPVTLLVAWLGAGIDRSVRKTMVAGAVVIVLTAGYSYFAQSASHRATLSFHNVVGLRILPDRQLTTWFTGHGMPLDDNLRTRTGKSGMDDTFYASTDPAFAAYRHWARGAGPRALAWSLVVRAPHYLDLMYDDLPSILAADVHYYDTQGVYQRLPHQMPLQLGGPSTRKGLTVWLSIGGAALAGAFVLTILRKRGLGLVVFGTAALVMTLVELYTTWGGDPVEMQRHMVGTLIRLAAILVVVTASAVDAGIDAWRNRPQPVDAAEEPVEPPDGRLDADHASRVPADA